ncbi:hypothetical protein FOCC_FOCC014584 [Frankliniella occidentalis]|nr:hypothetical protein FOCC_FOCC014584 [Frankliniella occidentalis]
MRPGRQQRGLGPDGLGQRRMSTPKEPKSRGHRSQDQNQYNTEDDSSCDRTVDASTDYTEIINWDQTDVSLTAPPVLIITEENDLTSKLSIADGLVPEWDFTSFPCHTGSVERTVKLVTEVSRRVIGPQARDGQIRSTLQSRQAVSEFESKKDFSTVMRLWTHLRLLTILILVRKS